MVREKKLGKSLDQMTQRKNFLHTRQELNTAWPVTTRITD
jgi:hypothetical protein